MLGEALLSAARVEKSAASLLNLVLRSSASVPWSLCFVRRSTGTLALSAGWSQIVCLSAGPTSQLLHCSPSPPSGKLICSRVLGPSAWILPFTHPTSMRPRSVFLIHALDDHDAPVLHYSTAYGLKWLTLPAVLLSLSFNSLP